MTSPADATRTLNVAMLGASGRMGRSIVPLIAADASGLRLSDAQVSKEHARVEWTGTGYAIVDLDSTFGTLVNNVRIGRHDLKAMDRIMVGSTVLVFET